MFYRYFVLILLVSSCSTSQKNKETPLSKANLKKSREQSSVKIANKNVSPSEESNLAENKMAIQSVIKKQNKFIGDCYGQALLTQGKEHIKGTMMIGFDIDPSGKAHGAKVLPRRSTIKSDELSECLISGLKKWKFPVKTKNSEVSVNYPFIFRDQTPKNMQNKLDRFQKIMKTR